MLRKFLKYSMFFFLIVALVLYFVGVREINLFNGGAWMRSVAYKFSSLSELRIPMIPEWNVVLTEDPAWYEQVAYMFSWVVNFFTGLYNTIHSVLNMIIDLFKVIACMVWTIIESPELLFGQ